ncbi:MAG: hypothetical protein KAU50_11885 [Candidatus Marinimicrobia bacterium]|nr:hypothetical protein [Candidatus Neomarinimicrobiota bacterium]
MKKALAIIISMSALWAQSITQVDFEVRPGNLIEISYTLRDSERNGIYGIDIYASLDGGYSFPIKAESVTGDVGPRVRGAGRKAALWKVLNDLPALSSENLVIKVVGRSKATVTGVFSSLFTGNRFTKRMSDGITFYGGNWTMQSLTNAEFQGQLDDGSLKPDGSYRFGLRITRVPFIYRIEGSFATWQMNLPDADTRKLTYLAYGNQDYNGDDLVLSHAGGAYGIAYTPLPVFGIFLPQIGGGAGYYVLQIGELGGESISVTRNPALFAEVAVQVNLLRWLKINAGYRQNFLAPRVNFNGPFLEAGLHISTK